MGFPLGPRPACPACRMRLVLERQFRIRGMPAPACSEFLRRPLQAPATLLVLFIIHIFFATVAHPRLAASIAGHHNLRTMNPEVRIFRQHTCPSRAIRMPGMPRTACQWPRLLSVAATGLPRAAGRKASITISASSTSRSTIRLTTTSPGWMMRRCAGFRRPMPPATAPPGSSGRTLGRLNGGRFRRRGSAPRSRGDPFGLFGARSAEAASRVPRALLKGVSAGAGNALGLDDTATKPGDQVKAQSRRSSSGSILMQMAATEAIGGPLREIIQAYDRLRHSGFC